MGLRKRTLRSVGVAIAITVAGALLLAACTSVGRGTARSSTTATTTFNAAVDNVVNKSNATGGKLQLLAASDCDSWDPARVYASWCLNMQRVLSRTLVNFSKVNGTSFTLAPDLATSLGAHNADFTEWKYTLQNGLKYSDGSPIAARDIKYAIERSYATDVVTGGPGFYLTGIINAPSTYRGPYKSGELPSSAIDVEGDTITFHLKRAFADFDYLLALPTSAPVPKARDTGAAYGGAPIASGPFQISSYTPTKSIVFTRNRFWAQATDRIRRPKVDEIDLTFDSDGDEIDSSLRTGAADARVDASVDRAFRAQILASPRLRAHADNPVGPAIRYIAIPATVAPFDNVHCRLAVFYAFNKAASLASAGGASVGRIAYSATPPGVLGYDPSYNPYPSGRGDTGDLGKAEAELRACGKPDGFTTKYAYSTPDATNGAGFIAVRTALARIGIKVTSATANARDYYSMFVGSPSSVKTLGLGLIDSGWGAEFPTPYGLFQSIVNGNAIRPQRNSNYASINIPSVNQILDDTGTPSTQASGAAVNHALMDSAQFLPIFYSAELWYRNPRLTNVTSNNALGFGAYDVVNMGVSDGR